MVFNGKNGYYTIASQFFECIGLIPIAQHFKFVLYGVIIYKYIQTIALFWYAVIFTWSKVN